MRATAAAALRIASVPLQRECHASSAWGMHASNMQTDVSNASIQPIPQSHLIQFQSNRSIDSSTNPFSWFPSQSQQCHFMPSSMMVMAVTTRKRKVHSSKKRYEYYRQALAYYTVNYQRRNWHTTIILW